MLFRRLIDDSDRAHAGGLRLVDLPPGSFDAVNTLHVELGQTLSVTEKQPLPCRLRFWHRWRTYRVPGGSSYAACAGCGRYMTATLFDRPWT